MYINSVTKKDYLGFCESIFSKLDELADHIVSDMREDFVEFLYESLYLDEASRFSVVNRVRGGKIQRRKKISNVKGYRFQDGRLVRMSPREVLNRKRAQRRGAIKRQSKLSTSLKRRKISIRRRGSL